jgi:catechol 2,3-dioxygenase-like lactoylglutathione lyase family enzyme
MSGLKSLMGFILVGAVTLAVCLRLGANNSQPQANPILINTCLITTNVSRLVNFYENVLGMKAQWSGERYADPHGCWRTCNFFCRCARDIYSWFRGCRAQQERDPRIQGDRRGPRICETPAAGNDLGQEADHSAVGHAFSVLPRPGWQPRRLLYAEKDAVGARAQLD